MSAGGDAEAASAGEERTFLGLDFSTQRLKAVVTAADGRVLHEAEVVFDTDLPEFRTTGGVLRAGERGREVTAPPLMWVKALDLVLDRLLLAGADFSSLAALSGAAQQHGSVWWTRDAEARLAALSSEQFLHAQLAGAFACDSPVWLDTSTAEHCRAIEEAVGGPEKLALITGSRAYERFTGAQIRKIFVSRPRVYAATARISLVSSFACSLLAGRVAPLDLSDASGMNLLDIATDTWHRPLLDACGDGALADKLGAPVPTWSVVGAVSSYFVARYGFPADCAVVAFTGDNPSALAGMRLRAGWVGLSLGTSDTLLLGLPAPRAPPPPHGHALRGPTRASPYMALLCFSNGSLTRQAQRDRLAGPSWDDFDALLDSTLRGNLGYMGVYYEVQEVVPLAAAGRWLWDAADRPLGKLAPELEARALLETQAVARRVHAEEMGFLIDGECRLVATGGAAANRQLLQIFADVFDAPVYVQAHGNAAVLGAATRAADVWSERAGRPPPEPAEQLVAAARPYADAAAVYGPLLRRYRRLASSLPAARP